MMSYAQGSSVGTTSTSVPECRKETTDRLAVCTAERTVTHRLPLTQGGEPPAQQNHKNHRGGAEPHGQDTGTTREGENHQHSMMPRRGGELPAQQDHNNHRLHRGEGGGLGVATLDHMYEYMCVSSNYGHAKHDDTMGT